MKTTLGFVVFATLCASVLSEGKKEHDCAREVTQIGQTSQQYIQCVINHGAPVHICVECHEQYISLKEAYEHFINATDTHGKKCTELYIDQDRLNIISKSHTSLTGLWDDALCKECYANNRLSNDTNTYQTMTNDLESCIKLEKNNSCSMCKGLYQVLNDFYGDLQEKHKRLICFDIQDAMNRTRAAWTKTCGHEPAKGDLVAFAVVSSTLTSLPILFYCGFFMYGRRAERNQQTLDLPNEAGTSRQTEINRPLLLPTPSTSTGAIESDIKPSIDAKKGLISLNDDDDDDDILT